MKSSKLFLIHIIALNRCMNNVSICTSSYYSDRDCEEEIGIRCKAMGFIRVDTCPIVDYVSMYDYFDEDLLKFLLNWS